MYSDFRLATVDEAQRLMQDYFPINFRSINDFDRNIANTTVANPFLSDFGFTQTDSSNSSYNGVLFLFGDGTDGLFDLISITETDQNRIHQTKLNFNANNPSATATFSNFDWTQLLVRDNSLTNVDTNANAGAGDVSLPIGLGALSLSGLVFASRRKSKQ